MLVVRRWRYRTGVSDDRTAHATPKYGNPQYFGRVDASGPMVRAPVIVIHQLARLLNLTSLASLLGYPDSVKGQIVCLQRKDLG